MPAPPPDPRDIPVGLGGQFRRQLPSYLAGLVLLAAYQYLQFWFDTKLAVAIDRVTQGQHGTVTELGVALIAVAVVAFVIRVLSRLAVFNAGRRAEYELRRALLAKLQLLGQSFFRRMSTGEIMSRVTNDLAQIRLLLGFGVLNAVNTVFALTSALAVTLSISPKLTAASLCTLPLLMVVARRFSKQMFARTRANQDSIGRMSSLVQSSIAGVRVVRSFGLERAEQERFEQSNADYLEKSLALAHLRVAMGPIMGGISALGILVVFWYGGHLLGTGEISTGGFLAFYRALARLTWPLIALGFLVGMVQRGRASYTRLAEVYEAEPDIVDGPLPAPDHVDGRLTVRDLSFAHGEQRVLDGVSFELPPGESLAIVGRTGSGKSTLASLLPRIAPTPRGSVFLDGTDVCDLPLSLVRGTIGYAQQTPFLFSTTVGRNVAFSLDEPDAPSAVRQIVGAIREANILKEVLGLPDGLDTVVGERGVQLSGGQKQRVALARAFVSEPRILVLDDPLSAVDSRTEAAILEAIDRQRERRGVILVTHRVAAAARCSRVIVLDGGKVMESGTHEELVRAGGLYATFAEEQRIESELAALGSGEIAAVPA
jgi:ATP-binding cassette, subfamily B, multidrug efflux pump